MDGLSITVTVLDAGTVIVALRGDLDLATRHQLGSAVRGVLARGPELIVVDLGGVKVLDSAGIGALVGAWKAAQTSGGRLIVRNPSQLAYWQLELSGLLEIFGNPQPASI